MCVMTETQCSLALNSFLGKSLVWSLVIFSIYMCFIPRWSREKNYIKASCIECRTLDIISIYSKQSWKHSIWKASSKFDRY